MAGMASPQNMMVAMQQFGIDENANGGQWANAFGMIASRIGELSDQNAALGVQLQADATRTKAWPDS